MWISISINIGSLTAQVSVLREEVEDDLRGSSWIIHHDCKILHKTLLFLPLRERELISPSLGAREGDYSFFRTLLYFPFLYASLNVSPFRTQFLFWVRLKHISPSFYSSTFSISAFGSTERREGERERERRAETKWKLCQRGKWNHVVRVLSTRATLNMSKHNMYLDKMIYTAICVVFVYSAIQRDSTSLDENIIP